MKIQYLGHSSFRMISGTGCAVLCDPYDGDSVGYSMPRVSADVITVSHAHGDHDFVGAVKGDPAILDSAIECFADDVAISSFTAFHDDEKGKKRGKTLIFQYVIDGIRIAHMGDIGELSESVASSLRGTDVLMLPVGGFYTVNALGAKWYADKIKPSIILPMHYSVDGCSLSIAPITDFTDLYSQADVQFEKSESLVLDDLPKNERSRVIVLTKYE